MKKTIAALTLAAITAGMSTTAWANADSTGNLKVMPVNTPVLISAGAGWQGHWAQKDLEALRAVVTLKPEVLVSGAVDPNEAMPMRSVADVLNHLYGAGGEQGDALDLAVKLGLIRPSDFGGEQIQPEQTVSRERFALLLTRALQLNGAEDPVPAQAAPAFVDASDIQNQYLAAVAMLQAEGLLIGDGAGRFAPSQPVTWAQATRTFVKVSAWKQQRIARLTGWDAGEVSHLINGREVTLTGGTAEQPAAPGSAAKAVTKLSDRLAAGDLTGDGKLDVAAVLIYSGGGSGTFYYLSVVENDGTPVNAAFLGDRIAVQNVRIVGSQVAVDLLTRDANEAMAVRPHMKETRTFTVQNGKLVPNN
ncbi:MAG TPA: S-layer homology domain-containing protein [Symbiobacteriaceae bacterium]|nr:S-layer homology domain-containing protein [Symbiobacteriaceae bacterium]